MMRAWHRGVGVELLEVDIKYNRIFYGEYKHIIVWHYNYENLQIRCFAYFDSFTLKNPTN